VLPPRAGDGRHCGPWALPGPGLAAALPGLIAVLGGVALAVAGAVALSPLAPVGPVRRYDPDRGISADGLVLGAGAAVFCLALLKALGMTRGQVRAVIAWQTTLTLLIAVLVGGPRRWPPGPGPGWPCGRNSQPGS
jgi:hypothetical protein